MTFTHDDIETRLVDFLYGEIDEEARAAFQAHLGACARCRADVAAYSETRATARAVVRAPLADAVPAAARLRILDAARRATAEREQAGAGAAAVTGRDGGRAGMAGRAVPGDSTPRWLAWLRAHWTLPVLTTAAAMGALLLFRDTLFREARRPLGETAMRELAEKTAPAPDQAAPAASPEQPPLLPSAEVREAAGGGSKAKPRTRRGPGAKGGAASSPEPRPTKAAPPPGRKESLDDLLSGLGISPKRASPTVEQRKKMPVMDDALADAEESSSASRGSPGAARASDASDSWPASGDEQDGARNSARGSAEPVDRAATAPAEKKKAPALPRQAAPAAAPSAAAPMIESEERPLSGRKSEGSSGASAVGGAASAAAAPGPGAAAPPAPAVSVTALVDRAEKFMAARRWNQAVTAYRDLLQRFPQHAAVPTWRRRLAAAQAAAAQEQDQSGDSGFAKPPPPR